MTEEELSAAVRPLIADWRAAEARLWRIHTYKRIGPVRRAQIADARARQSDALHEMQTIALKVGMTVESRGTLPILVEAR